MRNRDPLVIDDLNTAVEVLSNRIFRVDHPFRTTRRIFGASVLDTEGHEHSRRKRSWMQLFRRSAMEGPLESIISSAVDRGFTYANACGDLSSLCVWIPNRIILDMLGLPHLEPEAHYAKIRVAAEMLEANRAGLEIAEIRNYLRNPAFHHSNPFADLSEEDRTREIAVLLIAGVETTIVALELLLCSWVRDASGFSAQLAQQGAENAILQILCKDPPLGMAMRYTQAETLVGQSICAAGTIINVNIGTIEAADSEMAKIVFGRGRHQCPGKSLALRELTLVAERLAEMSPNNYHFSINQQGQRPDTFRHPGAIHMPIRRATERT